MLGLITFHRGRPGMTHTTATTVLSPLPKSLISYLIGPSCFSPVAPVPLNLRDGSRCLCPPFTYLPASSPLRPLCFPPRGEAYTPFGGDEKAAGEDARRPDGRLSRTGYGAAARYPRLWLRRHPSTPTRSRFQREAPGPSSARFAHRFSTSARLSVAPPAGLLLPFIAFSGGFVVFNDAY